MHIPQFKITFTTSCQHDKFFFPMLTALQEFPNEKDVSETFQPFFYSCRYEDGIFHFENKTLVPQQRIR